MKMMLRGFAAGMLLLTSTGPVAAQNDPVTWEHCLRPDITGPQDPELVIDACRLVLSSMAVPANVRNDAYNNIGVAYMEMHEYDKAVRAYSEALRFIRQMPDLPEVRQLDNYTRHNRARAYLAAKQYDNALDDYDIMVDREPLPKYQGMRCLAHALYDDNFASALADCQKAIDADKSASDAYTGWLLIEFRQGKYQDVKSDCELVQHKGSLTIEGAYVCRLADIRLGSNTQADVNALQHGLDVLEHGERLRELGMVP